MYKIITSEGSGDIRTATKSATLRSLKARENPHSGCTLVIRTTDHNSLTEHEVPPAVRLVTVAGWKQVTHLWCVNQFHCHLSWVYWVQI